MTKKNNLIILIPARSGSTRVKNKNLKKLGNSPLLGHKIKSCINSKIGKVVVSTNSVKVASYAKKLGAEVPFLRPKKYSTSKASTMSCVLHLIRYLINKKIKLPDYIAVLPATNPFLNSSSIKNAFRELIKKKYYNSINSYTESPAHPFAIIKNKKKIIFDIIKYEGYKYSDFERTQDWPTAHVQTPALKISKISYFLKFIKNHSPLINKKTIDMKSCIGYKVSNTEAFDIDTVEDFIIANSLFNYYKN